MIHFVEGENFLLWFVWLFSLQIRLLFSFVLFYSFDVWLKHHTSSLNWLFGICFVFLVFGYDFDLENCQRLLNIHSLLNIILAGSDIDCSLNRFKIYFIRIQGTDYIGFAESMNNFFCPLVSDISMIFLLLFNKFFFYKKMASSFSKHTLIGFVCASLIPLLSSIPKKWDLNSDWTTDRL